MFRPDIFLVALLLQLSSASVPDPENCQETIKVCEDAIIKAHIKSDKEISIFSIPSEDKIAQHGHWGGIKPESYHLNFNFHNRTHHNSSATLKLKVIEATNTIFLNQNADDLVIDYEKISLEGPIPCEESNGDKCIKKIIYFGANQTLVIQFQNFQLQEGKIYDLVVPSFHPTQERYKIMHREHAHGLIDRHGMNATLLTTHFQMRHARTAFPCLDQVALKSHFHVCISHPDHLMAATNGIPMKEMTRRTKDGRIKECFEPIPPLSTYLITISIMENYTSESIQMPGDEFTVELFAPKDSLEIYRPFLDLAIPAVQYMTRITGFKFPMKRLGMLIANGYPTGGTEHMGLITLNSDRKPSDKKVGIRTLYHEIAHLWIGDLVTVSQWKEICLQEGLTKYFDWKLGEILSGLPLLWETEDYYNMFYDRFTVLLREYETKDSADTCYGQTALFFHSIAKIMDNDFKVFEKFLAKLVERKAYGSANIEIWDEIMSEVTGGKLNGYIKGWFSNVPGPLYLIVSSGPTPQEIVIQQSVHIKEVDPDDPWKMELRPIQEPVPIPILIHKIQSSTDAILNVTIKEVAQKVQIGASDTFLLDPDEITLSRKLYSVEHYQYILKNRDHLFSIGMINERRLKKLVKDFCFAVSEGVFPQLGGISNQTEWKEVKAVMKELKDEEQKCEEPRI